MGRQQLASAEQWLTHLLGNGVSEEDYEALGEWCDEQPENRAEFELLSRSWQLSGELGQDPEILAGMIPPEVSERRPRHAWRYGLLAAAVLASILAAWQLVVVPQNRVSHYQTARGEQLPVALEDGSRIHINTATTVDVAASGRQVHLLEGEAFFDVRSRERRPFAVDAGAVEVRVLGTKFSVYRRRDGLSISVLEGRVAVETGQASHELEAGQTLKVETTGRRPRLTSGGFDLARVKAWQEGKVELDHTPLREAVRELSRYMPTTLEISGPGLGELKVSGVFHIDRLADLDAVRFALENSLPVKIRPGDDVLEVIPADG